MGTCTASWKRSRSGPTSAVAVAPRATCSPAHAAVAAERGSLNVGRFFFRVRVETGQLFDLYYDRAMKNVDERKGQWFVYRELVEEA